jgi:hypothetical protein
MGEEHTMSEERETSFPPNLVGDLMMPFIRLFSSCSGEKVVQDL